MYIKSKFISIAWLIALSAAMLFSCSEELPTIKQFGPNEEFPTLTIENLRSTYTKNGKIKGKLQANIAKNYDGAIEPYVEFPNGISIVLYKENKIETSLTADKAIYYQSKRSWEATGNVVISNINGDVLKTEKLYGDEKEKKIFTNEFVRITKSDGTNLNSKSGFESNTEFTIYKFLNVDGQIYFREELSDEQEGKAPNKQNKPTKPQKILPEVKKKPQSKPKP
jgi:LPS export ABC transporter protein LptC